MNKRTKNSYETNLPLTVKYVKPNSIADEIGFERGDRIIKINSRPVRDELDYYYFTSEEYFTLEILTRKNEIVDVKIERDSDEEMGLVFFERNITKECSNHCLFCFIDQMPPGMRETLYIKDDDERLSFLNGNYITLTNLTESEIKRIIEYQIPVNISVHTTDENLRVKMLRNKKAGNIKKIIKAFSEAGIRMNVQIVLVPDINDKTLETTIEDLSSYYPNIESISVVPVGLTKYRDKLYPLRLFSKEEAQEIIKRVELYQGNFLEKYGTPLVYISDEFYLTAGVKIPTHEFYGDFSQLENGVGMVALFESQFNSTLEKNLKKEAYQPTLLVTGSCFYPVLKSLIERAESIYPELECDVIKIENDFFGRTITVAGLLTGEDIFKELSQLELENYAEVILPESLLKNDSEMLLDDWTVKELSESLNIKISVVSDGETLVKKLLGDKNG